MSIMKMSKLVEITGWERKCVCCGTLDNLSIDHMIPRSEGGSNTPANYQIMCVLCNQRKGSEVVFEKDRYIRKTAIIQNLVARNGKTRAMKIIDECLSGQHSGVMSFPDYSHLCEYFKEKDINYDVVKTKNIVTCPVGRDSVSFIANPLASNVEFY